MADQPSVFGKSMQSESLADYESPEEFSGDTRTIKHLLFPWMVETESPMFPGETILTERTAKQGDEVSVEELGPLALEKGERLGAFFTDAELAAQEEAEAPAAVAAPEGEPGQMSVDELAQYIEEHHPNVDQTIALADNDPEQALKVLDAETQATSGVPRAGVEKGLEAIIARSTQ
jgi:hypothetical protein